MLQHRWFRSWKAALLALLAGFLYLFWVQNVMPYGGRMTSYRYAHWLFTPTSFLFLIAGIAWVLVSCAALASSFGLGARERAGQRWLVSFWFFYATFIFGIGYSEGSSFPSKQHTIRQSVGWHTYLLQGTSGNVSGHMFYWFYQCDRLELACMYLTNDSIAVLEGSQPQLIVDQGKRRVWVEDQGKTVAIKRMPQ
jgi:hypothetical protein